jgi:hypothetical protein
LRGSGVRLQEGVRDATVFGLSAFNVLVAEVRQEVTDIGHDGTGVSLVKIENADLCRMDQDLTVVEIAVNKTGRAVLISGRPRA